MVESLVGIGFAILAAVGIAVQSLAVRFASRASSVSAIVAGIFVVNLLVVLPLTGVVHFPRYGVTATSLLAFAVAGLLGSLVARVCYFVGIARLGASRTEPLKALFPLVAVGVAVVVLEEAVTLELLAGTALILGGCGAVVVESCASPTTATGRTHWIDVAFPLAAALFLGVDPIFTKLGLADGTPALVGLTIRVGAAASGFGFYLLWRRTRTDGLPAIEVNRWVVGAGLANTAYLLCYYAALDRTPVSIVTPVLGTSTLLVVAGAAVFLRDDEGVTWTLVAAALVVVAGTVLVVGT